MRKRVRKYAWALAAAALGCSGIVASMSAQGIEPLPRLHVADNRLETSSGTPVSLRGVSLCGLAWQDFRRDIATAVRDWKANVVRLAVQPREWRRVGPQNYMRAYLDPAVTACAEAGAYCVIDWHEIRPWQQADDNAELERFWSHVAPRYAHEPHILYELFNEPTSPGARTRDTWLAWRSEAQPWVDAIRSNAPDTVILVGSPHWSQMPDFAVADPFTGGNLVYVMHLYPGWSSDTWDRFIGAPSTAVPLFISEWGWSSRAEDQRTPFHGTRERFAAPLRAYLDERSHVHWTAWSYHERCGPAMLGSSAPEMGAFVREWLHEIDRAR